MGGPHLDRGRVIRAHAHGEDRQVVSVRDAGEQGEMRRGRRLGGGDAHQPLDREPVGVAAFREERIHRRGRDAPLLRLVPGVHLDQELRCAPDPLDLLGERGGQREPVEPVDHVEQLHGLARLVRLQRSDEVKLDIREARAERRPFRLRFLHVVLAEHPLPGLQRRQDPLGGNRLRHGDQGDRGRVALGILGRLADPVAHRLQPGHDIGGLEGSGGLRGGSVGSYVVHDLSGNAWGEPVRPGTTIPNAGRKTKLPQQDEAPAARRSSRSGADASRCGRRVDPSPCRGSPTPNPPAAARPRAARPHPREPRRPAHDHVPRSKSRSRALQRQGDRAALAAGLGRGGHLRHEERRSPA